MSPRDTRADPWHVLGIQFASSPRTIKTAYHRLCRILHPDKDRTGGTKAFQRLQDAYQRAITQAMWPQERRYGVQDFLSFEHNNLPAAKAIRRDDPAGLANCDTKLGLGNTLLHFAAKFNAIECLRTILSPSLPKSQLFATNDAGETPMSLASADGLELLKSHMYEVDLTLPPPRKCADATSSTNAPAHDEVQASTRPHTVCNTRSSARCSIGTPLGRHTRPSEKLRRPQTTQEARRSTNIGIAPSTKNGRAKRLTASCSQKQCNYEQKVQEIEHKMEKERAGAWEKMEEKQKAQLEVTNERWRDSALERQLNALKVRSPMSSLMTRRLSGLEAKDNQDANLHSDASCPKSPTQRHGWGGLVDTEKTHQIGIFGKKNESQDEAHIDARRCAPSTNEAIFWKKGECEPLTASECQNTATGSTTSDPNEDATETLSHPFTCTAKDNQHSARQTSKLTTSSPSNSQVDQSNKDRQHNECLPWRFCTCSENYNVFDVKNTVARFERNNRSCAVCARRHNANRAIREIYTEGTRSPLVARRHTPTGENPLTCAQRMRSKVEGCGRTNTCAVRSPTSTLQTSSKCCRACTPLRQWRNRQASRTHTPAREVNWSNGRGTPTLSRATDCVRSGTRVPARKMGAPAGWQDASWAAPRPVVGLHFLSEFGRWGHHQNPRRGSGDGGTATRKHRLEMLTDLPSRPHTVGCNVRLNRNR